MLLEKSRASQVRGRVYRPVVSPLLLLLLLLLYFGVIRPTPIFDSGECFTLCRASSPSAPFRFTVLCFFFRGK